MASSILPTDLLSQHDAARPCSRASGLHDVSALRKKRRERKRGRESVQRAGMHRARK